MSLDELANLVAEAVPKDTSGGLGEHLLLGNTPQPDIDKLPLSDAQERLWFMDRLSPGKPFANLPFCLEIKGNLDNNAFGQAWLDVIGRHEPLTSIFPMTEEGKASLRFLPVEDFTLGIEDISGLKQEEQKEHVVNAMSHESSTGFDLVQGPLVRGRLICHGKTRFTFLYNFHHIVFDGWSVSIFIEELFKAYETRKAGKEPDFPALTASYSDYAIWHKEQMVAPAAAETLRWWESYLNGIEDLELPTDYPRKDIQSFEGETIKFTIPAKVSKQAEDFALASDSTPFAFWLSVFSLVLGRYAGQNAFAVGSPVAGRDHQATEPLVGFFVNNLIVKVGFSPSMTVREFFSSMRKSILLSFEHVNLPFQTIAESMRHNLDLSRNPIFQAALTYQNFSMPGNLPQGLSLLSRVVPVRGSHMDMDLMLESDENRLTGFLLYSTDLFSAKTANGITLAIKELARVITGMLDVPLGDLFRLTSVFPDCSERGSSLLSTPHEDYLITSPWNLFQKQVELKPDEPALILSDDFPDTPDLEGMTDGSGRTRNITYSQLAVMAESMATDFADSGVDKEHITALLMLSGVELIAAMLAVWRLGGTWVPLDPNHPPSRQYEVLHNSGVSCLIGLPRHTEKLELEANGLSNITVHATIPWQHVAEKDSATLAAEMDGDDIICILHTSGSTGVPKSIPITVRGICHRITWMQNHYPAQNDDLTCQKTSPLFGDYMAETFGSLMSGISVLLLGHDSSLDVSRLMSKMEQYNVTQIGLVTSLLTAMHRISDGLKGRLPTLRRIISSGEGMPIELADVTVRAIPGVRIINLYGSIEVLDMTCFDYSEKDLGTVAPDGVLPAGRPLPGVAMVLLDANLVPVPLGETGVIHVSSPGLMPGYISGGSDESFISLQLRDEPENWFKIGDTGFVDEQGRLIYQGRKDQQIKLRGVRVEPKEVRQSILEYQDIEDAFVTAWHDPLGNTRLVAFIVREKQSDTNTADQDLVPTLRSFLLKRLPAMMLPDFIMPVDAWPRTPSGKINAPKLLETIDAFIGQNHSVPGIDEHSIEGTLYRLWTQVVGAGIIHVRMNFFEAGGNSLLLVYLHEKLQREFAVTFPLTVLFQNPTIESQAEYLRKQNIRNDLAPSSQTGRTGRIKHRTASKAADRLKVRGLRSAKTKRLS